MPVCSDLFFIYYMYILFLSISISTMLFAIRVSFDVRLDQTWAIIFSKGPHGKPKLCWRAKAIIRQTQVNSIFYYIIIIINSAKLYSFAQ